MPLENIDRTIGRYEVVNLVSRGGMGSVYRARDPTLQRAVAIKLITLADEALRGRFLEEAIAAASLHHPNIVTIYDYGEHEGQPFIVMEFIEGNTVAHLIRERSPLSLSRRLEIIEALCRALEHAHNKGIVHRDIKPANVMVSHEGGVKVLDFGIAQVADSVLQLTAGGMIGTPSYMSPEQVEGHAVDRRSDVFSVGSFAYELLSSTRAFEGEELSKVVQAVVREEPVPLSRRIPGIDPALERIVDRALEKDPARRYQRISDMAGELADVLRRAQADRNDQEYHTRLPSVPPLGAPATVTSLNWQDDQAALPRSPKSSLEISLDQTAVPLPATSSGTARRAKLDETAVWGQRQSAGGLTRVLALPAAAVARAVDAVRGFFKKPQKPASASAPTQGELRANPEGPILLGVSAPCDTSPKATFTARFVAYVESRQEAVKERLNQLDREAGGGIQTIVGLPPERQGRWLVGTPVTVRLSGEFVKVEPATHSFEWNGFENIVSFMVSVDRNAPRVSTQLCFEAFIAGIPIASIPINITIKPRNETQRVGAVTAIGRPLCSAFASYSSKDSKHVGLQLSALKRWDPGADVFVDCLDLTPNEDWKHELERVIPSKETFLLFWSVNARSSPSVAWELEHARMSKGIGWIRPMPIDDPEIAPPPEFLQHLQFRDKYLIMRQAFLLREERRPVT